MGIATSRRWRAGRIVASLMAAMALGACEFEEEEMVTETVRPVRVMQIADASDLERRWFSGRAKATQAVDLSFRVAGPLIEFPVNVGDKVQKDDLIAQIDPATFIADVNKARAELERAIAEAANADAQLARHEPLTAEGWTAQARFDEYVAAAGIARAAVEAQRAILHRAELELGYSELRAPFTGEIVQTFVENFQDVREKQPVARLVDSSWIEMVVDVPETLISYAHLVRETEVIFDTFPDLVVLARIKEIGAEASQTTRTYPVTLIMDQPENAVILPGMAGKASPKGPPPDEIADAGLIVPDTAVFTLPDEAKTNVWVFDPQAGVVHRREIRTGNVTRFGLVVLDGVEPGEWVVTAGVHHLEEGQRVRPLEELHGEEETEE